LVEEEDMTVIVACRAADGTLVFGSDQRFTSGNEIRDGKKLSFHPMLNGIALIGMAAEDVNHGFAHKLDLLTALNHVTFEQDPIVEIQERMKASVSPNAENKATAEVEILCGLASPALQNPKLLGIFGRGTHDLDKNPFCCIGSGAGTAGGFLKLASKSLVSLRDVQVAVCTSIWLAKRTDSRCGGQTDMWWLSRDSGRGELEIERVKALEAYIATSLPDTLARWIANAPF
jgi:20S proteasome alpha/beta subunit